MNNIPKLTQWQVQYFKSRCRKSICVRMVFQLWGQKFMNSGWCHFFCSDFIVWLKWRSWPRTQSLYSPLTNVCKYCILHCVVLLRIPHSIISLHTVFYHCWGCRQSLYSDERQILAHRCQSLPALILVVSKAWKAQFAQIRCREW